MQSVDEALARLVDHLEIDKLITRFGRCIDTADWDGLAGTFADGAVAEVAGLHGATSSPREFAQRSAQLWESMGVKSETHYLANREIGLPGNDTGTAIVKVIGMASLPVLAGKLAAAGATYHFDFTRTAQGWRISRFVEYFDWMTTLPDASIADIVGDLEPT